MSFFLNIIYFFALILFSPILLYRIVILKKYRRGFAEKWLGQAPLFPEPEPNQKRIWLHAVSVGEMNLLKPIIKELEKICPDCQCVISTTSQTGMELGRKIFSDRTVFYCPLDFSFAVRRAFQRIKPNLLVLAELELWPNLVIQARKANIRLAIVNGRISDKSFKNYRTIRWFTKYLFGKFDLVAAQDRWNGERFEQLGAQNVQCTGSIKFDGVQGNRANPKTLDLAQKAGIMEQDLVFLAGSTQDPEEKFALNAYKNLRSQTNHLRLILVPRHKERFDEVAELLATSGLLWCRRSLFDQEGVPPNDAVILIDTIGELGAWWGTAEIAFVGGSMGSRGGQNMLEPAAYGAAVSFGPNTKNFRDISSLMLKRNAAQVVSNQSELEEFVKKCINDTNWRKQTGNNARQLVTENQGAAERTCLLLSEILSLPK